MMLSSEMYWSWLFLILMSAVDVRCQQDVSYEADDTQQSDGPVQVVFNVLFGSNRNKPQQGNQGQPNSSGGNQGQQSANCSPVSVGCQSAKYRTFDGTCNNQGNPSWGAANTVYGRLLRPNYGDGYQRPTTSMSGKPLPSARLVSSVIFPPNETVNDPKYSLLAMQWGQFITHDMSLTGGVTPISTRTSNCCKQNPEKRCFPIPIPTNDPFYSQYNQTCMSFIRTDTNSDCVSPYTPVEQLTSVTQWMDLSIIYGSSKKTADSLRTWQGGELIVDYREGREWPPESQDKKESCFRQSTRKPCYRVGDVRVNQNPQLTILHVMMYREHNRVARQLYKMNPNWSDEILFQEARKITIAEHQHISYYEWLPIFLGRENLVKKGVLHPFKGEFVNDYNPSVKPNVLNEHATAAFRLYHTSIQGQLRMYAANSDDNGQILISDFLHSPAVIEQDENFDGLSRGMVIQPQQKVDRLITAQVTTLLFKTNPNYGSDLRSIDIQRGRDHGLAFYNDYRQFCGSGRAQSFSDFTDLIKEKNVRRLQSLYESPDDVELLVGAGLERLVDNTLTGPTFLCIMTQQFYKTRVADRFFYSSNASPSPFTIDQLTQIKTKTSIARILCDHGDDITMMQPQAFDQRQEQNQPVPCSQIPSIDLEPWRDS